MKKLIVVFILISCMTHAQETKTLFLSGQKVEDNVKWDFLVTSGRKSGVWQEIRVPSCWELEGFGEYNYGHDGNKSSEKGLYKSRFKLPEDWSGKRIFIVFDGSMTDTKVTLNGEQAGEIHQGSFYRFKREITHLVSYKKENLLEVEVSKMSSDKSVNQAERKADFWVFGGIFRPVFLEAVPSDFIEYTGIDALHDGEMAIEVNLDKPLDRVDVSVEIFDLRSNQKLGEISENIKDKTSRVHLDGKIEGVKPWNAESPHLYKAVISVSRKGKKFHTVTEIIGFRSIEVKERDGVYINGEKIRFKGVNRHSFWPSTGRTMSREQSLADALLIKEMNMNAVRMSHYPPDKHLLEICDSLGLYVINELCAWQSPPYDTPVGTILVNEMLKRDINHPSIIFWANGNEGGFNHDLDPLFHELDIQKRPVLHPWGFDLSGKINTAHYINYNSGIKNMFNGRDIFMPTELLHGLYDGGHGAGLDDYWNLMLDNPLSAGMFLWDFADQGVVRTDKNGILDTDKDHGADGIVGPYREKEGSFFTIKEIWSPVFVEKKFISPKWNGKLNIENRYNFTNTNECSFSFSLSRFTSLHADAQVYRGGIIAPDIAPGHKGELLIELPDDWAESDFLYLTIRDKNGHELFTWSFEINTPAFFAEKALNIKAGDLQAEVKENDNAYLLSGDGVTAYINKETGLLDKVVSNGQEVPLSNGPVYITDKQLQCKNVVVFDTDKGTQIDVVYNFHRGGEAYRFSWLILQNGILQLDYEYRPQNRIEMSGVTFDFPEEGVTSADLLANGPYRVYNNRMKGGKINLWKKTYNDAITGEVWDYPEFKGYYSLFYAMRLESPTPFEVYSASEDISLHLFTPTPQQSYDLSKNYTVPSYPKGDLSFLDAIPPVGTKFGKAENYGPQSQLHLFKSYSGLKNIINRFYFKFN